MSWISGPKITIVGGGSYTWSPRLICDLLRTPELDECEYVLLDPDTKAMADIEAAARTMAKTLGKKIRIRSTTNEASAFRDADFVVIWISTGALKAMDRDLKIPEKYGIFHTVGDSVGPAGWSRILRNVPVFAGLGRKIQKYAPNAVVINYTNPMAALTATLDQVCDLRHVGLCHGLFEVYRLFEKLFKVEEKDLTVQIGGVNHFFWVLDFTVKGKPGYPLLRKRLGKNTLYEVIHEGTTDEIGFHSNHAFASLLLEQYGYLPYIGDRHTCEMIPGYITPTLETLDKFKLRRTSAKARVNGRKRMRVMARRLASGKLPPPKRTRETAADILCVHLGGREPFVEVVNLPNTGQIDNLPRGAVIETMGVIDPLGFHAIDVGPMPEPLRSLVEPQCIVQNLTVEAALERDKEKALHALTLDPLCSHLDLRQIRQMGEELIKATQRWMPPMR